MKLNEIKQGKSVADLGKKYKGGDFSCSWRGLTSLEGAPQEIGGSFHCVGNKLTSLEGAPQKVGGDFECYKNDLTSLEGAPLEIGGSFNCSFNYLTSLKGAPRKVGGDFYCNGNNLTSLEGAPQEVGGSFVCYDNKLTSLNGIHKLIHRINGKFHAYKCPIQSHVLGLLLIKDLKEVMLDNKDVAAIINAHLDGGSMRSAMDCQHALIKAGFPEYAKL